MKAILEFDLDDFSDQLAHLRCVKSQDMALALWCFYQSRKTIEWRIESNENKGIKVDSYDVVKLVFESLYAELEKYDINIDKLIE